MEITRIAQKIKTLSLCSTKRLFKFLLNKFVIISSLFLFSCSSYLIQAEEIKPKNLKCGSNSGVAFFEKNGSFTIDDKDFNYKLGLIDKNLDKSDFNFIYISKPQTSGGYVLEVEKITKNKNKHRIYFKEKTPPKGSSNIAAITATYCFLQIDNFDKVVVFIR